MGAGGVSVAYTPTPGVLPGEQWSPSNACAGDGFQAAYCCHCARDSEMNGSKPQADCTDEDWCQILGASYRGEAVEWRELDDGRCVCVAFVPVGERIPQPRCERTAELFGEVSA